VDNPNPLTCEGTRTYTYEYLDCSGNATNWTFVYTIDMSTSPVVPADGSSTVDCVIDVIAPTTPILSDVCGNNISPVLESVVDSPDPLICAGTRTYNYSYTDCSGNIEYWSYIYTISDPIITVSCPPDQSFNATPGDNYTIPELVATDNCSGGFSVDWIITGATNRTGSGTDASGFFAVGVSTINWEITDACGNTHTCSTIVEILMPLVECPDPIFVCYDAGLQLLSGTGEDPEGGVFTGNGVVNNAGLYYFDPANITSGVGTHTITYTWTNPSGYEGSCSFEATVFSLPTFSANVAQHPLCYGEASGEIDISITGGFPTYNIDWGTGNMNSGTNSTTLTNLNDGIYNIVVTDINGCSAENTVELNEPNLLELDFVVGEILCNGQTTDVTISATGGTPSYTGTGTFTVSAGDYNYIVTDNNGCQTDIDVSVTQPEPLTLIITTNSMVTCNGLSDGSATATCIGGVPEYDYQWNDPDNTNSRFANNLPAGTWICVVTDENACTTSSIVNITEPSVITATLSKTDVSCYGGSDGVATVSSVSGGTPPHFYEWSTNQYTQTINGLVAANYQVTITDAHNCEYYDNITVNQPMVLQVYLTSQPAQCGGAGGSAFASVVGGTGPYNFAWSNGQGGNNIANVDPGDYVVTVIDSHFCETTQNISINITGNIQATINQTHAVSCPGDCDGIIEASCANGVAPIEYNWTSGETSPILTNLCADTYIVIVSDAWGCTGSANTTLTEPESIILNSSITNNLCFGDQEGSISINVIGGFEPYSYSWNTAVSGSTISNLPAGEYIVTVTDLHSCSTTDTLTVTQPEQLILEYLVNNISCYGDMDGAVSMSATGGTMPYQFSFTNGVQLVNGSMHTGMPAGEYTLLVNDNNECHDEANIWILEPAELTASYTYQDPSCIGNNDGYIEIAVMGGTEPYLFGWNEYVIDIPIISGLTQGDYEVQVVDSNNCVYLFNTIILTDMDVDCIKIPNAFTPNGDGPNDTWIIENIDLFPGAYMYIYNRWGQELWVGRPGDEWNGQYNGKFVPAGTYLYIINLYDGSKPYTGTVTVIY
ncbi:MAG: gliding motility-associated C-terminal domain-containing protein, partial [Bacteroidales bacterium]|nr:gliding motility-associated C-terminal domain-containing protein [Bacteroidales bacterium]